MATAIGLSMQISASTSGLGQGLSKADKLINQLSQGAVSAGKAFDAFRDSSGALPPQMQAIVDEAGFLAAAFRGDAASAEEFKAGIDAVAARAAEVAKVFQDGAATTAKYATEQEKNAAALANVEKQHQAGAISAETYKRAVADLSGENAKAAAAEKAASDARARAAQITAQVQTPAEKYNAAVKELKSLLSQGLIKQETYNRALEKAKADLDKAAAAADGFGKKAADANKGIKLNELSGILGVLPGQFGAVAARVSSFASAGEGLQKLFGAGGGGLGGAFAALGPQIAALANPLTLAIAGVAAFGAAATAVVSGLSNLADRVEKLGFQAEKVGASFEFLQVLETAAQRSGSSIEAVGGAFNKMLRAIDAANNGSKVAAKNFSALGVSADDLKNKTPEEIFKQISAELIKIEDPAKRSAAAMKIFGRSGADLIPTLKAVGDSKADMERFQAILTDLDKVKLDGVDSAFEKLATSGQGLTQALLLPFANLTSAITRGSAEFTGGITAIVKPIGQVLEPALQVVGFAVENLLSGFGAIGRAIGAVLAPFGEVAGAVGSALSSVLGFFGDLNTTIGDTIVSAVEFVMSFTPIGLIADNIGLVSEAFSSLGSQVTQFLQPIIDIVERIAVVVGTAFSQVGEAIFGTLGRVGEIVGTAVADFAEFTGVAAIIQGVATAITTAFGGIWDGIKGVVSSVGGFIETVVKFAEDWLGIQPSIEEPVEAVVTIDTSAVDEAVAASQKYSKEIAGAAEAAAKYGQEGFDAAFQYQEALKEINSLVAEGALTQEEAKRAVQNAGEEFKKEITILEANAKEAEKAAAAKKKAADEAKKAADKQIEADRKAADAFMESQKSGDTKGREQAQEAALAITRDIGQVQKEIDAARAKNDQKAVDAGVQRLQQLEQAQAAAREKVEFGFTTAEADNTIEKVRDKLEKEISQADVDLAPEAADTLFDTIADLEDQLKLKIIDQKQFEDAAANARKVFEESKKNAEKVRDLQEKYSDELLEIELNRVKELSKASSKSVKATDARTSEGASEILRLATGREDPAIEEYRKQRAKLDEIKQEIVKIGGAVEIV